MKKTVISSAVIMALIILSFGCSGRDARDTILVLSSTTSVQDSGLLDVLVERFEMKTGIIVKAIASGSGRAIQMGRLGEADILWVHSPLDEERFMADGYGKTRVTFMHNDFVLLGPVDDPANVAGARDAQEAFKKIVSENALFISRGDNSGTHKMEIAVREKAGLTAPHESFIETGQGMGATLFIADEKGGYCLSDRTTYLSMKESLSLIVAFDGDPLLINRYSLIVVNPDKAARVNVLEAEAFLDFMLSGDSKRIIENFGKEEFGQQAFFWDYAL